MYTQHECGKVLSAYEVSGPLQVITFLPSRLEVPSVLNKNENILFL